MITVVNLYAPLTPRICEVLTWAARGKTASETAQILGIAPRTVEKHVQLGMRALGAMNRTHAAVLALRAGLIAPFEEGTL